MAWGGQEIRILSEAMGMRNRGHHSIISAHPESRLLYYAKREGFETIPVVYQRRNFPGILRYLKKRIENENVHIVNTHSSKDSWLVLPAARLAKNKPLVIRTRHLSTPIGKNILSVFLYNYLPHVIITTGETIRKQMITVNRFNHEKIISIPTGVDTDIFDPQGRHTDIRGELNLEELTPLVGTVSVIRNWKGLDYFVKSVPLILKKIPEARFIIAGDGPDREITENLVKETVGEGKVFFLGHREDSVNVFHSLDILVHPSYANEGVPQSILQAMAMRTPVIASDLPPLKELVFDGQTGLTVPVRDPEGIANAVMKLLFDKGLSAGLAENGRKLVLQSYSFPAMLDKLETLYETKGNGHRA